MGSNQQSNDNGDVECNDYLWSIFKIIRNLDILTAKVNRLKSTPAQESLIVAINKHYDKVSEACKDNLSTCKIDAQYDIDELVDDCLVMTQSVFNDEGEFIGTLYTSTDGSFSYKEIGIIPDFQGEEQYLD